jgi:hypothetical protein
MKNTGDLFSRGTLPQLLATLVLMLLSLCAQAQDVQHLSTTQPGGMPGLPMVTGVTSQSNQVTVTWDGPSGYYQLYHKPLTGGTWQPVGGPTNLSRRATLALSGTNTVFRVHGPAPEYAGMATCLECHQATYDKLINTPHVQAFASLAKVKQDKNANCLPCHTIGYGLPTGFISAAATPQLEGVQCENCHGPAGNHAANPDDPTVRPRVELAATVCGGCHVSAYNQWSNSAHAGLVAGDLNSSSKIDSCGRCHSASVRESLLESKALPMGDANLPIGCATCHDSHQLTGNPAQLFNPLFSTNNYSISTSAPFTNQYNAQINLCAQCHNRRGAVWTDSSRSPHHSPQYNILLGNVGELASGSAQYQPASHALLITNQCAGCHMQQGAATDQYHPPIHGHDFTVNSYALCLKCHPQPQGLVEFTQGSISNQIQQIKAGLDHWALTKSPPALQSKYGARAWEYSTPGDLSPGGPGPTAAEQALIPVTIQKARFNLYLVFYDGSYGVHNAIYEVTLLDTAQSWVQDALNQ